MFRRPSHLWNAPSQPRPRLSVPIAADCTSCKLPRVAQNPINTKTTKQKRRKTSERCRAAARKQNTNISKPSFAEVVKGSSNNALDAKEVMTKNGPDDVSVGRNAVLTTI
ncbi:hypothetical protein TNCV_3180541 [Trichonephila clavipes]|nr:hypothetical protein TNCV_3180541 [Trichonephila clavipes]